MQKKFCENRSLGQDFMNYIKRIPFSILSWFTHHAETIVCISLFLVSLTIWLLVLYYSTFNDETASVLSFLGVASIVFATKRNFGAIANNSAILSKVMGLEFLLIALGGSLLAFTKFSTTAFYLICLGMIIQKIRYKICLEKDSGVSLLSEVSQESVHCEHRQFPNESDREIEVLQSLNTRNLSETVKVTAEDVQQLDQKEEGFDKNAENLISCAMDVNKSVLQEPSSGKGRNYKTNDIQNLVIGESHENTTKLPTEFKECPENVNVNCFNKVMLKESIQNVYEEKNISRIVEKEEKEKFERVSEPETVNQSASYPLKQNQKNVERLIMADELIESRKNVLPQTLNGKEERNVQTDYVSEKCLHEKAKNDINSSKMSNKAIESRNDTEYDINVNKLPICVEKQYSVALQTNKPEEPETLQINADSPEDAESKIKSTAIRNKITPSPSEFTENEGKYPVEFVLESKVIGSHSHDSGDVCESTGKFVLESEIPASRLQDAENVCKSADNSALANDLTAFQSPCAENEGKSTNGYALSNKLVDHSENSAKEGKSMEVFALGKEITASHFIDSANSKSTDKIASPKEIATSQSFPDTEYESTDKLVFENEIASSYSQATTNEGKFVPENGASASNECMNECKNLLRNEHLAENCTAYYESKLFRQPSSKDVFHSAYSDIQCKYLPKMSETMNVRSNGNLRNVGDGDILTGEQNIPGSSRISDVDNIVNRIDMSFIYAV